MDTTYKIKLRKSLKSLYDTQGVLVTFREVKSETVALFPEVYAPEGEVLTKGWSWDFMPRSVLREATVSPTCYAHKKRVNLIYDDGISLGLDYDHCPRGHTLEAEEYPDGWCPECEEYFKMTSEEEGEQNNG